MSQSIWFGAFAIPQQPIVRTSIANGRSPKSLKLNASLFDYPLASKIMVRNLSYSTSESHLQKEFSNFGHIDDVKVVKDQATKRSKGYAFIQYTSQEDAILALENMNHKYFDGRVIFVELAKPGSNFGRYPKTCGPPKDQNLRAREDSPKE